MEGFLKQERDKLNMQDAVRQCNTEDEGRLLAMNIRKLDAGYSLQGNPFLFQGIASALGVKSAKPIQKTINDKARDGDDESQTREAAQTCKSCVGKAMHISQPSWSTHSAQREHTFQIDEESDDISNAKAQGAYSLLAWHE